MRSPHAARILLLGAGLAALSVPAFTAVAQANTKASSLSNTTCSGTLPPATYINVTAQSGSCVINMSSWPAGDGIQGSVTVQGATLTMWMASVKENVTVQSSSAMTIEDSTIGGSVTVQNSAGPVMAMNVIGGNLIWQNNTSEVYGFHNQVQGNIVVQNTTGGMFEFNSAGSSCIMQNSLVGWHNMAPAGATNTCN
jgi:hypothetical protein